MANVAKSHRILYLAILAHSSPRSTDDLSMPDEGELGRLQGIM